MTTPLPPPDLASRELEFLVLPAGAVAERFYANAFAPLHFDRGPHGRMNAPDGAYGVLYAAADLRGAFAETFLRAPGRTLLPLDLVRRKSRVRLRVQRALRLVRFAGAGLARHDDDAVCYAIFDHAEPAIAVDAQELDLDKDWFWALAEAYGVGLAPPGP